MQNQSAPMRAAIDIGSNTIHIVVARCTSDDLDIVADEEELVRIGESVTTTGAISAQKRDQALATLCKYKALAEQHGSELVLAVATEAIRQASNASEFLADVQRETGLEVYIINGDVEATLTFYGATYELYREAHPPAQVGVMDLGGGSLELVTAKQKRITWRTSVPIGSGWLHDRYLPADPPSYDDLDVAHTFLRTYFSGMTVKSSPPVLIVTGGSSNSLLRLARAAFGLASNETRLTYDDILRCEGLLNTIPAQVLAERYQQSPQRIRILPAGTLIIQAAMQRLQLSEIRVSSHGIREGALLAYTRYGEQWLHQASQSAKAARAKNGGGSETDHNEEDQDEAFIHFGRHLLRERTHKMLDWRKDVLKHEDIEDVHKMRVASRRLRAVLDAYESLCAPKPFKKAYRQVKDLADMLGKARDTDVLIEHLQQQLEQASSEDQPGIHWLIARLRAYREQHQQKLEAFLQDFDDHAFEHQIKACLSGKEER